MSEVPPTAVLPKLCELIVAFGYPGNRFGCAFFALVVPAAVATALVALLTVPAAWPDPWLPIVTIRAPGLTAAASTTAAFFTTRTCRVFTDTVLPLAIVVTVCLTVLTCCPLATTKLISARDTRLLKNFIRSPQEFQSIRTPSQPGTLHRTAYLKSLRRGRDSDVSRSNLS